MANCCQSRLNYKVVAHPKRRGWERVTCKQCGKWIGDRDPTSKGAYSPK